jgi:hypothetical protein
MSFHSTANLMNFPAGFANVANANMAAAANANLQHYRSQFGQGSSQGNV